MHGCEFEDVELEEGSGKFTVRVQPGTEPPELMKIGHTNMSMTFTPDVKPAAHAFGANTVYMDCPGFLDNRGAEINIANAINIKATLAVAASVRVIVLINDASLKADRGRGVRELAKMLLVRSQRFPPLDMLSRCILCSWCDMQSWCSS